MGKKRTLADDLAELATAAPAAGRQRISYIIAALIFSLHCHI